HGDILPARPCWASQLRCHLFVQQTRVIEVPKAAAAQKQSAETPKPDQPGVPMDAVNSVLGDGKALRGLLTRVAEQARLKKLDRATLTAARELSNAVHPHRDW
ncbi:hypothetical protein ACJH6H_29475, partial [Mycobacterium sp. SMC-21]|uniref:hypothetical protein n=1 Tax=Mycobacterium sp. SMC-21 TaxID=3381632 RepID=UPI003876304D